MVQIFYNGTNPFAGIAPTPFVGVSDDFITYGQRWGNIQKISLQGTITGSCNGGFPELITKQSGLYTAFGTDFKNFQIKDGASVVFESDYVKVDAVDFDQSPLSRTSPFKIELSCYPSSFFSGVYGVTSPTAVTKFQEQKDGIVNITRNFSAKGFNTSNTSNNALDNARNYVQSLTGVSNVVVPSFININPAAFTLCPRRIAETINRMEATYSVDLDYAVRMGASTSSVISYSLDVGYDDERGLYSVSLKGNLKGTMCDTIDSLRSEFAGFTPYDLALTVFTQMTGYTFLNPIVDSINISENEEENVIDFSYTYTSDPQDIKFDYSIDVAEDYLTDKVTVGFNGTLTARGPQQERNAQLESALANLNILPLCQSYFLTSFPNPNAPLNPIAKNYVVKRNITGNSISISSSFENSPIPPNGFVSFNWSIHIKPSLHQFHALQYLDGGDGAIDLGMFNRGDISIQGSAVFANSADHSQEVRAQALNVLEKYAQIFSVRVRVEDKVERNLTSENNGYGYSFTITDTGETTPFKIS